jgi:hypothetical protein
MNTVAVCLSKDNEMESLSDSPSFRLTSETLYGTDTQNSTKDIVTSFLLVSLANPSPLPVAEQEPTTREICGPPLWSASASYDPASHSWKMSQGFLLVDISEPSWETWPKAGITHAGAFYPQPSWERRIGEIGSGLLPTPVVPNGGRHHNLDNITLEGGTLYRQDGSKAQMDLQTYVRMWPTPQARDFRTGEDHRAGRPQKNLNDLAAKYPTPRASDTNGSKIQPGKQGGLGLNQLLGGKLNPRFVEWLMDMPDGWLSCKPLEMHKWQAWLRQHGVS